LIDFGKSYPHPYWGYGSGRAEQI